MRTFAYFVLYVAFWVVLDIAFDWFWLVTSLVAAACALFFTYIDLIFLAVLTWGHHDG